MANNRDQSGVKVFTATVFENLEDKINQFLTGGGTEDDPRREILFEPVVILSGGTFYCLIYYRVT